MRIFLGILLLIVGVAYPMGALFWLNGRMNRQPLLTPRQVSVLLAFNGVLPVGLIIGGLSVLAPRLWTILAIKAIAILAGLAAAVLLLVWFSMASHPVAPTAGPVAPDARSGNDG